jgi:hypothetical protein
LKPEVSARGHLGSRDETSATPPASLGGSSPGNGGLEASAIPRSSDLPPENALESRDDFNTRIRYALERYDWPTLRKAIKLREIEEAKA